MTWTTLSFPYGSTLTSTKITQLYDNITALANADSGAPRVTDAARDQLTVYKTAVTSILNSSTLTTDPHLVISSGLTSSTWYRVLCAMSVYCSLGGPNTKVALACDGTGAIARVAASAGAGISTVNTGYTVVGATIYPNVLLLSGFLYTGTGVTTVSIDWAQETAQYANSYVGDYSRLFLSRMD